MASDDPRPVGRAYRVVEVYPAIQIELSGEEVEALLRVLGASGRLLHPEDPYCDVLKATADRLRLARTEVFKSFGGVRGERKVRA